MELSQKALPKACSGTLPQEIDGEFLLDHLPCVIYLQFEEAKWKVGKLPVGVYPLKPRSRTWKVNTYTGIEARRTGFWFVPDFGSTAHMIQGATLNAAFVDPQDAGSKVSQTMQTAAYVCLSRVKELQKICVVQAFSPLLFTRGPPTGPNRLMRKLAGLITTQHASAEWWREVNNEPNYEMKHAGDPLRINHSCTSCYLQGKSSYMLHAKEFGITKPQDFYS